VQRETKEVAELVEKLREKLEPKPTSASPGKMAQRPELSPNRRECKTIAEELAMAYKQT
jgi:hypothetical protein